MTISFRSPCSDSPSDGEKTLNVHAIPRSAAGLATVNWLLRLRCGVSQKSAFHRVLLLCCCGVSVLVAGNNRPYQSMQLQFRTVRINRATLKHQISREAACVIRRYSHRASLLFSKAIVGPNAKFNCIVIILVSFQRYEPRPT